jgi:hypothetical protein
MTTCVLVTVDASERIAWLHDRMPAVLRSDEEMKAWLAGGDGDGDGDSSDRRPETLLRPYAAEDLAWHPVTSDVNAAGKLEGPRCCAPARRAAERDAGSVAGLFAKAAAFEEKKKNESTPEKRLDRSPPFRTRCRRLRPPSANAPERRLRDRRTSGPWRTCLKRSSGRCFAF